MSVEKSILGIVPIAQSAYLASYAYRAIPRKRMKRKKAVKNFIKTSAGIAVGSMLIKETSGFTGAI